ncbi:MAG: ABC transporter ATP-binding protein [Methanomassiliicoccales archaeon]
MLIQAENLSKYYGDNRACSDICLSLEDGQVFGLLGPNGAGKSTLIKMLVGLVHPTSGQAMLNGLPVANPRARVQMGYLPELFRFYDWLTGKELLQAYARVYGLPVKEQRTMIEQALELVGLKGRENDRIGNYSKGMQQRLGLAGAIVHRPRVVFLDEPTSALDPRGRMEVREIISRLHQDGTTIFVNSHLLSEVELTCTHLAFIKKGQVIAQGPTKQFLTSHHQVTVEATNISPSLLERWYQEERVIEAGQDRLVLHFDGESQVPELVAELVKTGAQVYRVEGQSLGLESVFLDLTE